jgi:hypothetical protein
MKVLELTLPAVGPSPLSTTALRKAALLRKAAILPFPYSLKSL